MSKRTLASFITEGIIHANPLTVRLVGLCPALFACATLSTALALGVCTVITLVVTALVISLLNKLLTKATGALAALFIACGVLTAIQLFLQAYMPHTAKALGVYLPLVAVSGICHLYCGRFALRNSPLTAVVNAFCGGIGYTAAMLAVALVRELFGRGAVFGAKLFNGSVGLLTTPAGGFICLGLLAALFKLISGKRRESYDD